MVHFSGNIIVVSIVVGFTLNYVNAEIYANDNEALVAKKTIYGSAGIDLGHQQGIVLAADENKDKSWIKNDPKSANEYLISKKAIGGQGDISVGFEKKVKFVNGKMLIQNAIFGYIGGQLSFSRTMSDCYVELFQRFGEKCVLKNNAKLCANRAMIGVKLDDLPPNSVARAYFELLMGNILTNGGKNIEEFCEIRFQQRKKDLHFVLDLIHRSDVTSELDNNIIKKELLQCIDNLNQFGKGTDQGHPSNKTRRIFVNVFKNINLIDLTNTDEIDYFIDNIFNKFKIDAVVPSPEKFCLQHYGDKKYKNPVEYTTDNQNTTPPGVVGKPNYPQG